MSDFLARTSAERAPAAAARLSVVQKNAGSGFGGVLQTLAPSKTMETIDRGRSGARNGKASSDDTNMAPVHMAEPASGPAHHDLVTHLARAAASSNTHTATAQPNRPAPLPARDQYDGETIEEASARPAEDETDDPRPVDAQPTASVSPAPSQPDSAVLPSTIASALPAPAASDASAVERSSITSTKAEALAGGAGSPPPCATPRSHADAANLPASDNKGESVTIAPQPTAIGTRAIKAAATKPLAAVAELSAPIASATPGPSAGPNETGQEGSTAAAVAGAAAPPSSQATSTSAGATAIDQVLSALRDLGLTPTLVGAQARRVAEPDTANAPAAKEVDTPKPAVLRSMTIQLNPEHLGPVSITMRLKAGAVDIRIAVVNPETLHLLDQDRHLLTAMVAAAGRSTDSVVMVAPTSGGTAQSDGSVFDQAEAGDRQPQASTAFSDRRPSQGQSSTLIPSASSTSNDSPIAPPSRLRGLDGSLYL